MLGRTTFTNRRTINIWYHLIGWIVVTIYFWILDPVEGPLLAQIPATLLLILNYAFVFYSVAFSVAPLFHRQRFLASVAMAVLTYLTFAFIDFLNFNYVMSFLGVTSFSTTFTEMALSSMLPFTMAGVPAVGYYLNDLSIQKIEITNAKEKAMLVKELQFLKNQFNSHITFNFLNYCYSNIHKTSPSTAEAIDLFSDMLRYSLTIKADTRVPIQREIDYIKDFIELQKLLSSEVHVEFKCEGGLSNQVILPGILITLVENAFNHGDLKDTKHPIRILLKTTFSSIQFSVTNNKRRRRRTVTSTGVGLANLKHLLTLYYPDKFKFEVSEDSDRYVSTLELQMI